MDTDWNSTSSKGNKIYINELDHHSEILSNLLVCLLEENTCTCFLVTCVHHIVCHTSRNLKEK